MTKQNDKDLLQYFIDAITNYSALLNAQAAVDYSEKQLIENIKRYGEGNHYTSAENIPPEALNQIAKESINVHLSKAQSQQIDKSIKPKLYALQEEAERRFVNRKISLTRLNDSSFEACYYDSNTGKVRFSKYKPGVLKGKLKSISLIDNVLFVEPNFLAKKLNPNRIMFKVQVLQPQTLTPGISVKMK